MAISPKGAGMTGQALGGILLGDGLNLMFATSAYKDARKQGDGRVKSLAKGIGSFAWGEIYYGGMSTMIGSGLGKIGVHGMLPNMAAMMALNMIPAGISIAGQQFQNMGREMDRQYTQAGRLGSGYFNMSQAGYTMRQRSLNAIQSNGLNTRSVLGNEARTFFRSSGINAD